MTRIERFRELAKDNPENILHQFSLGQALFDEGSYEEASHALNACIETRPDWMLPRILLGKALIELRRIDDAKAHLEASLQLAIDQHHEGPEEEVRKLIVELDKCE